MWNQDQLLLYWKKQPTRLNYSQFDFPKLALVHQQMLPDFPSEKYPHPTAYFRYCHSMNTLPAINLGQDFDLMEAKPEQQSAQTSDFLNRCYPNMNLDPQTVLGWIRHPTFLPDLWLWIVDLKNNCPAALGIAEFDPEIKEGALEWIQVHPDYRRQGLGKAVVIELLMRLKEIADFTTVSGQVDNPTNPGMLYKSCGFEGEDIWWVFQQD